MFDEVRRRAERANTPNPSGGVGSQRAMFSCRRVGERGAGALSKATLAGLLSRPAPQATNLVVKHIEAWDVEPAKVVRSLLKPSAKVRVLVWMWLACMSCAASPCPQCSLRCTVAPPACCCASPRWAGRPGAAMAQLRHSGRALHLAAVQLGHPPQRGAPPPPAAGARHVCRGSDAVAARRGPAGRVVCLLLWRAEGGRPCVRGPPAAARAEVRCGAGGQAGQQAGQRALVAKRQHACPSVHVACSLSHPAPHPAHPPHASGTGARAWAASKRPPTSAPQRAWPRRCTKSQRASAASRAEAPRTPVKCCPPVHYSSLPAKYPLISSVVHCALLSTLIGFL